MVDKRLRRVRQGTRVFAKCSPNKDSERIVKTKCTAHPLPPVTISPREQFITPTIAVSGMQMPIDSYLQANRSLVFDVNDDERLKEYNLTSANT